MERDVDNLFRCGVDRVSFSRHDIKTEDHSLATWDLSKSKVYPEVIL